MDKNKVLAAVQMAVVSDVNNLTCDRIDALTGGHGMLNMAVYSVTNVLAEELLRGADNSMKFANMRHQPVEDLMKKAIEAAKSAGADAANAALVSASVLYLTGTAAQVGIPAGNRKLGAMARLIAGADRCGVATMPTAKMNNKISGFPAVAAIYQAMAEGKLTSYNGRDIPANVGGGPLYGHSALGEDFIWPEMAKNGARIGTEAMLNAMAGAAIIPDPFTCALYGAAAILEIIHPDAEVPEGIGAYGRASTAYLVGKTAAETAELPEKLHVKIIGEEWETAKLVGDMGLLLKDIGGVSVIGMMALNEIFSIFQEGIAGSSGSPVNPPLGHLAAYCVIALKEILNNNGNIAATAKKITEDRLAGTFDPEAALICLNTISRKSLELRGGPVSETLIAASEPARANAIYRRAETAYEMLLEGAPVDVISKNFDDARVATVTQGAGKFFSEMTGSDVKINVKKIANGARRTSKLAQKYLAFDPLMDIEVEIDGSKFVLDNFIHDLIPKMAKGERQDVAHAAPYAAAVACELTLAGSNIINVIIPAATAAAMGKLTPDEAAKQSESGAYVTAGIPGSKAAATKTAQTAVSIMEYMSAN